MPELRAATPADAKAVWQSFEKAGTKPTIRDATTALNQCGQFMPVATSTVHRWKQNGWTAPQREGKRPAKAKAKAKVEAAVPAVTGDPTTRAEDLGDPAMRAELAAMPDGDLMKLASREAFITAIVLMREVQKNAPLAIEKPKEIGGLQEALAGSLGSANDGFTQLLAIQDRLMTLIPNQTATEKAPENEPLSAAIAAFSKAENEHG